MNDAPCWVTNSLNLVLADGRVIGKVEYRSGVDAQGWVWWIGKPQDPHGGYFWKIQSVWLRDEKDQYLETMEEAQQAALAKLKEIGSEEFSH